MEAGGRGPVDQLAQRPDVADAEIVFRPQREERGEQTRDAFLGREIHLNEDGRSGGRHGVPRRNVWHRLLHVQKITGARGGYSSIIPWRTA